VRYNSAVAGVEPQPKVQSDAEVTRRWRTHLRWQSAFNRHFLPAIAALKAEGLDPCSEAYHARLHQIHADALRRAHGRGPVDDGGYALTGLTKEQAIWILGGGSSWCRSSRRSTSIPHSQTPWQPKAGVLQWALRGCSIRPKPATCA
jgi:hypothetical protein